MLQSNFLDFFQYFIEKSFFLFNLMVKCIYSSVIIKRCEYEEMYEIMHVFGYFCFS